MAAVKPALIITFPKRAEPSVHSEPAALLFQVRQLMARGGWAEAAGRLQRLAQTETVRIEALNLLGITYLALKEYQSAQKTFETVLSLRPRNVCALVYRGELAAHAGEHRQARSDWRRAITVGHPDEALIRRAWKLLAVQRSA